MARPSKQAPPDASAFAVEIWPIDRPVPYARNPRKISDKAIDKVAASIKEFGWQQPIVVDRDGVIVVGHTRHAAARRLGMTEVPVRIADELTPAQARAYRILDNRAGEETEWDKELLVPELHDLNGERFDLNLTGFDVDELEKLMAPLGDSEDGTSGEDVEGDRNLLLIEVDTEQELQALYTEMQERGLQCKIMN